MGWIVLASVLTGSEIKTHLASCTMCIRSFVEYKCQCVVLDYHPALAPRLWSRWRCPRPFTFCVADSCDRSDCR